MRDKFRKLRAQPTKVSRKLGLASIYNAVGLPPVTTPEQLTAGDDHILKYCELRSFVDELYGPVAKPSRNAKFLAAKSKEKSTGRPTGRLK